MTPGFHFSVSEYEAAGCNVPSRHPSHEIGFEHLSPEETLLWAVRSQPPARLLFHKALHAILCDTHDPGNVLCELNRRMSSRNLANVAEAAIIVLDHSLHELRMAAAGDFLPLIRRPTQTWNEVDRSRGDAPLGMLHAVEYVSLTTKFEHGMAIFWASPYTLQIRNRESGLYMRSRLLAALSDDSDSPRLEIETVLEDIRMFSKPTHVSEDICLMSLRRAFA
jgi:serine phosphatase RsbU (regulator of sigma subunit)